MASMELVQPMRHRSKVQVATATSTSETGKLIHPAIIEQEDSSFDTSTSTGSSSRPTMSCINTSSCRSTSTCAAIGKITAAVLGMQLLSLVILNSQFPYTTSGYFLAPLEALLIPFLPLARTSVHADQGQFKFSVFGHKWMYWPLTRARARWFKLQRQQTTLVRHVDVKTGVAQIIPISKLPSKPDGSIRYVAITDTHLLHNDITPNSLPKGDVLIHCGDILVEGGGDKWKGLFQDFSQWLGTLSPLFSTILVTGGNHDHPLQKAGHFEVQKWLDEEWGEKSSQQSATINYVPSGQVQVQVELPESTTTTTTTIEQQVYMNAASRGNPGARNAAFQYTNDTEAEAIWSKVPPSGAIDVLVTHGPPTLQEETLTIEFGSCPTLFQYVHETIRPKVHVFGHNHQTPGAIKIGDTLFINAVSVDFDYAIQNPPVVFDVV